MELSIICVNWNSLEYLKHCLASIYQQTTNVAFEVIVVDNASTEPRIDSLVEQFPAVRLINSHDNLGFSRANNLGFRHSVGDYLLFLNPDTELLNPAINIMLDQIGKLSDAGVVGCTLLNSDLSIQTASIQKFPTILNQVFDIEYLRMKWPHCRLWGIAPLFSKHSGPVEVEVIPGACMLLKRAVFEQVGLLSEEYFMYAEDIDLNHKLRSLGLHNYYVGDARIVHHGGKSSTQQAVSQWATVMKFRAMVKFYRKTRGHLYAAAYTTAIGCSALSRVVLLWLASPLGGVAWSKAQIHNASAKWKTVLKCALGVV